ncbi:ABC-F family ATP-binding cassette domain-containing protein [Raineya orbicola]|jgi:ATP-binding cassette subfamily F protein 3|uniref:Probable ATP-binding protein YbiT n=1 Tax=Raineya orbicola TaxID=2016530 RepID=A0A2N3IAY2_9BACT|nr:ABC-F family ATP-binding cassette domain-containing protein [Raineya orbicola]PKQ67435.1 ATPase components of ABC transporters with duplicated ATPase domain [Raineya orbicola]
MLTIHNLSFAFGGRILYESASLQIKPKDRIGLIGLNGTGKSTLLRLIVGEYQPESGTISRSKECTIGFLNQDLLSYQSQEPILKVAMQAFERQNFLQEQIQKVLSEMETNYSEHLLHKLSTLQEEFAMLDGYNLQSQAEKVLEGLGFRTEDLQKPLQQFSGGWRMRVMLAKLLLQKPALLMLDEPTNHLDLPSIEWLEEYLADYEGAILVVSHDRDFLDNTCETIVEVAQKKLNVYVGNYSDYLEQKAEREEIQRNAYENQQAMIRQTERFINRFRAKATKARQVQSRIKMLERLERIEEVKDENVKLHFRFTFSQNSGRQVAELKNLSKSYGSLQIFKNTSIAIERGDKIAFIGANGKGKSTLLRILQGSESYEGEIKWGHNVKSTYYAQHQIEALTLDNDLLTELRQTGTTRTEVELRTILGCFLFSGEDVFKKIRVLSGGEKSRVALAKTLLSDANFLLLDEPTNHLDMISANILAQALKNFEGTFVVVSHDRNFIRKVANKIWYIENEQIKEFLGGFDEYEIWQEEQSLKKSQQENPKESFSKTKNTSQPPSNNTQKQQQKAIEKIEQEITLLETEKSRLENELSNPEVYEQINLLQEIQQKYEQICKELNEKMQVWENMLAE